MLVLNADRAHTTTAGTGAVTVARGRRGSVVTRAFASSPLKWLTPQTRGSAAWLVASSYGGGLVDGDALTMEVTIEPGASALLSTQSSTKVYRSVGTSSIALTATVNERATLVSLPDPIVCFAGSRFRQTQTFELGHGARVIALEWLTSGRLAYGERWVFNEYAAQTLVRSGGRAILHDAVRLNQLDGDVAMRMGRFEILVTIVVAGEGLEADVRRLFATVAAVEPQRQPRVLMSAAPVADGGCVVRLAGVNVEEVRHVVRTLLDFLPAIVGDDPWVRKW